MGEHIYVSDDIHRHVQGKIDVSFAGLGNSTRILLPKVPPHCPRLTSIYRWKQ